MSTGNWSARGEGTVRGLRVSVGAGGVGGPRSHHVLPPRLLVAGRAATTVAGTGTRVVVERRRPPLLPHRGVASVPDVLGEDRLALNGPQLWT